MDTLTDFQHLDQNIPLWMKKIDHLAAHIAIKREEFAAEYRRALKQARPRKRRSQSVVSLRSTDPSNQPSSTPSQRSDRGDGVSVDGLPEPTDISPLEPATKYLLANARRGRRPPTSSVRSKASATHSTRQQRLQLIIYYDSTVQDGLGELVREIGTARNLLRQRQHARTLEHDLQLPSLRSASFGKSQPCPSGPTTPTPAVQAELAEKPPPATDEATSLDGDAPVTEATGDLETAQSLCETAAHQILRDGDCSAEVQRIRACFANILRVTRQQMESLPQESSTLAPHVTADPPLAKEGLASKAQGMTVAAAAIAATVPKSVAELEVDSDNGSDEDETPVSMAQFRTARTRGLRA